jgi:hypothetical protein
MFSFASYKSRPNNFKAVEAFGWFLFYLSITWLLDKSFSCLLDEIHFLMHNSVGHVAVHILQLDKVEFSTLNL